MRLLVAADERGGDEEERFDPQGKAEDLQPAALGLVMVRTAPLAIVPPCW